MYLITKCYRCGHHLVFAERQKTVLCRRCEKKLDCGRLMKQKLYKVSSLAKASVAIGYLESRGRKPDFETRGVER